MRHKLFVALAFIFLCGCLADNQVSVSSSEDYSTQGLTLQVADTVYRGSIVEVKVKLNYTTTQNVVVNVQSTDGTAISVLSKDYLAINKTLTIPAGQSSISFDLETFSNSADDGTKNLTLDIVSATGADISQRSLTVEIHDFEKGPYLPSTRYLASGASHNCAALFDKRVKCWGGQSWAQTGTYSATTTAFATELNVDTTDIRQIASYSNQTCLLYLSGKLVCWGSNFSGSYEGPTTYLDEGSGAAHVALGQSFLCVVYSTGTVGCIGDNTYSQLGAGVAGSNYPTTSPGMIPSITNAVKVYAGGYFACAILSDASVVCWGSNWQGDLGSGVVNANYMVPVVPAGVSNVQSLALGLNHACAITAFTGQIKCWGNNSSGQLGLGTVSAYEAPTSLPSFASIVISGISANGEHTCARDQDSNVYCWGNNVSGQLGNNNRINQSTPVLVQQMPTVSGIFNMSSGTYHNCIITSVDYKVYCWGESGSGQVSQATAGVVTTPVDLPFLKSFDVTDIIMEARSGSGTPFGCAKIAGVLNCWGNNTYSQLAVGNTTSVYTAKQTAILPLNVTEYSLGLSHGCALLTDGTIYCWGRNNLNQIADGSASATVDPAVSPSGFSNNFTSVKSGDNHSCALTSTGQVYCWGDHTYGQAGTCVASNVPQLIAGLSNITKLELKNNTSCAIDNAGLVYCWGSNGEGQFGNGQIQTPCQSTPLPAVNGEAVSKLAMGQAHGCALMTSGAVKCWGSDLLGQLGNGSASNARSLVPVAISSLANQIDDIVAGQNHTCVLMKTSGVKCWGKNASGQLGFIYKIGTSVTTKATEPTDVFGLKFGVDKLTAVGDTSCAISVNGQTKCWGSNFNGLLDTERVAPPFPIQIYDQFQ